MNTISQNTNLEKKQQGDRTQESNTMHPASANRNTKKTRFRWHFGKMRLFEKNKTHKHKLLAFFVVTRPKTKSGHETGPQGTDFGLDP